MGILASIVDAASTQYANYQTAERDREARAWQERMWRMENEYNLPVNQRKRLEDAGINPNLAFGSSASVTAGNPPSSPAVHAAQKMDVARFWLEQKKANADIRREDQVTEQLRLNNEMLSLLFNDKVQTERGDMFIKRIRQGWMEDHLKDLLNNELTNKELQNDLLRIRKDYIRVLSDHSKASTARLKQDYDHFVNKYGFEDLYYGQGLNPYETSTILGFARSAYGPLAHLLETILGYYGIDIRTVLDDGLTDEQNYPFAK